MTPVLGIEKPHFCSFPRWDYVIRWWKNPPEWTVWKCDECGITYRLEYDSGWYWNYYTPKEVKPK